MAISIGDAILKMGIDKTDFDNSMKSMDQHIQSSMQKLQSGLRIGGAAFTAFGAAGLKMVSSARELNAQLGQTALKVGVSTKEMRDLALATTNVTFPLDSVAKTFDLLGRAGVTSTEQMQKAANAFDALADATGSSAEEMADLLLPAFKLFGEEIPTTSAEMDKFTWLTKNSTVDLSDFGTLLTKMAPYMDELNLSMDDAIIMLKGLSEKGIQGTAATLALRTAITQAASSGESLTDILGLTEEELEKYRDEMENAAGITDEYAAVANEQYGIMDKLKQKFQEISLAAGSFLTPLEPVLGAMTALGPVMLFFSTSVGAAAVKTAAHTAALIAHNVAMVASKVAIGAVTAAQWLWNAAMSANPIGLIILGIAALVAAIVLLVKNWDTVKEKTIEVWNKIVDFFKGVVDKMGQVFARIKDIILTPFRVALQGIESGINWLIRQMNKISFTIPSWVPLIGGKTFGINIPEISLPKFEKGGLITEPTLLYGLRSMRPYAIAGEKGTEVVSPAGAGVTNNFNISQLVVREESDVQRIARELFRLQQQRGYASG